MADKIIIRAMKKTDLDDALKLWITAFNAGFSAGFDSKEVLLRYMDRNPDLSTVACMEDGTLVGALMCGHDGRRGSIYHTAVYPDYRHQGIGHRMEKRSLAALKAIGITTGFLFIHVKNPGSEAFWNSIGWQTITDIRYLYKEF